MSPRSPKAKCVLAIDPMKHGFGFVVLEGPACLIDWAVVTIRASDTDKCLNRIGKLLARYDPDVLVLEDGTGKGSRRCVRVQSLLDAIDSLAARETIATRRFSRQRVRQAFAESGARTKHEIAKAIATRFPELEARLPRFRKPWMSEDDRMSIFDAASFALAFFHGVRGRKHQPDQTSCTAQS